MSLAIAALPDDPTARPRWLDEQLVGDRLGELAAELAGLHPDPGPPPADLLGPYRADLLARGTAALPPGVLRELLRHPALLFELQELVLLGGGPYWDGLPRPVGLRADVERGRAAVAGRLPAADDLPFAAEVAAGWGRPVGRWVSAVAVAFGLLLAAAGVWRATHPAAGPAEVAWGWARPGALPAGVGPPDYYRTLAAEAREWYDERPTDTRTVARRIHDFRRGCTALLLADHPPLSAGQAADLRDRCRKWAAGLDQALAALEAGKDPAAVRADVDGIANKLVAYLESQADAT